MADQRLPVFIHAWWRSSSTYVWSKLREDRSLCCYYEPLHPQIAALDPAAIRSATEATVSKHLRHPLPDRHSFAEYFEFGRPANALYTTALAYDRYLLRPDQEDSQLRAYLDDLVQISRLAGRLPVLCFCRSQMRSAWMKQALGGCHVAQIRDPMAQWDSFNVRPYFVRRLVHIAGKLHGEFPMAFAHIEEFTRQAPAARPARQLGATSRSCRSSSVMRCGSSSSCGWPPPCRR